MIAGLCVITLFQWLIPFGASYLIIMVALAGVYLIGGRIADLVVSVALVGALLGFLRYNFYPAKIFLGNSGSLCLGYLLAIFALRESAHDIPVLALVVPVVAMGLPILDKGTSHHASSDRRETVIYR